LKVGIVPSAKPAEPSTTHRKATMHRSSETRLLVALITLCLGVGATSCGGSGDDAEATTASTEAAATAADGSTSADDVAAAADNAAQVVADSGVAGDSGTATMTMDGETYTFTATSCAIFEQFDQLFVTMGGENADGYYFELDYSGDSPDSGYVNFTNDAAGENWRADAYTGGASAPVVEKAGEKHVTGTATLAEYPPGATPDITFDVQC
jgi:hypothetical protein